MTSIRVAIAADVLGTHPDYVLGLIAIPQLDIVATAPLVEELLATAEEQIRGKALTKADVAGLPPIAAWREAYRRFGMNPNRFPSAVESITRRVAKGDRLPRINAAVDLCNSASLTSFLPIAACEVDEIGDQLEVRRAIGTEVFLPLGAADSPETPDPGEVIYADGRGRAHSRRWNWRQSEVIRTDTGPHRLLITVESAHPQGRAAVTAAMESLGQTLDALGAVGRHELVLDQGFGQGVVFESAG